MAECDEKQKSLLMIVKEETEKAGVKLNIQETKSLASSPIASWQIDGKSESRGRFYCPGLQNYCGRWLQPWNEKTLAPWKEHSDKPR